MRAVGRGRLTPGRSVAALGGRTVLVLQALRGTRLRLVLIDGSGRRVAKTSLGGTHGATCTPLAISNAGRGGRNAWLRWSEAFADGRNSIHVTALRDLR